MKNIIRCLFGIPVIWSVPLPPSGERRGVVEKPVDILLEGLAAKHSCCTSCGFSYCPSLDDCVRPWETYCQEFDFPYNVLYKNSGIIIPPKK